MRVVVILILTLLVTACTPTPPRVVVEVTTPPEVPIITEARERLSGPVLSVADGLTETVDAVDQALHVVPRGQAQEEAVDVAIKKAEALEVMVADLRAVTEILEEPVVAPAIVEALRLADLAADVSRHALVELEALEPFLRIDERMGDLVEQWDQRGSRRQVSRAFNELAEVAREIEKDVRQLPRTGCLAQRSNRVSWAALLRARTDQLNDAAQGADGTTFDELRERFSRGPYGEDRAVADGEGAACWVDSSPLIGAPDRAAALLLEVEQALNPR